MHHTKDKGYFWLLKVCCDLSEKGFKILTPMSEHLPFDIVVYNENNGELYKVQIKYRRVSQGKVTVPLRTSSLSSSGSVSKRYDIGVFDVIAVYCPEIDSCAYISEEDIRHLKNSITLRVEEPKVGITGVATTEIRFFKDYEAFPFS